MEVMMAVAWLAFLGYLRGPARMSSIGALALSAPLAAMFVSVAAVADK